MKLRVASLQADNAAPFYRATADYLGRRLGWEVEFIEDIPWRMREKLLDSGRLDAAFVCGWPYTCKIAARIGDLALLAAPVFSAPRYAGWPIYFSDVIVAADSDIESFDQLRGRSWAFNEPGSHSGYNLTLYHLAQLGHTAGYFGEVVEAGAHQVSIDMVVDKQVDASAIDSYVLEVETSSRPELADRLRVIDTLGPSPSPPFVAGGHVPEDAREAIAATMTAMHCDDAGAQILRDGLVARFARVVDEDYDTVRAMARRAEGTKLTA